jgi:hypothetical protein
MTDKVISRISILFISVFLLASCQKEIDGLVSGGVTPPDQKPQIGTVWTYRYYTYHSSGGLSGIYVITHRAQSEENLGGEKWLRIIDVAADTTVYFLNVKATGLYQYTNNNSYLLCKYPAALNDTYNTFNAGAAEDFTVKGVNDTLPTGIGDIPANYYEGEKNGYIIDYIWYNNNTWIVRKIVWRQVSFPFFLYYRYSTMFLDNIVY